MQKLWGGVPRIDWCIVGLIAVAIVVLSLPVHCQQLPDAPSTVRNQNANVKTASRVSTAPAGFQGRKPLSERDTAPRIINRGFVAVELVRGAAQAADVFTTVRGLRHGCTESNPLLGSRPSVGAVAGYHVAIFGGFFLLDYELQKHVCEKGDRLFCALPSFIWAGGEALIASVNAGNSCNRQR